jgi:hypothetical protein
MNANCKEFWPKPLDAGSLRRGSDPGRRRTPVLTTVPEGFEGSAQEAHKRNVVTPPRGTELAVSGPPRSAGAPADVDEKEIISVMDWSPSVPSYQTFPFGMAESSDHIEHLNAGCHLSGSGFNHFQVRPRLTRPGRRRHDATSL